MGKVIMLIILLLSKIVFSQKCIVEIHKSDKYKLEKLNKTTKRLIVYNHNKLPKCNISNIRSIIFIIEKVKRLENEKYELYSIQDLITCRIPKDYYFFGLGLFKIGNKYYEQIEVIE